MHMTPQRFSLRRKLVGTFSALLLLSACSGTSTWLPSYTDPDFMNVSFRSVAAMADTSDLAWRKTFESALTEEMRDNDAVCYEASMLMPPTRSWSNDQIRDVLSARGIDAWLSVCTVRAETFEEFVPERRETVKDRKPIVERVRYKENGVWKSKDSVTGHREVVTTETVPAHSVLHGRAQYHLSLHDAISGRVAWVGDIWADADTRSLHGTCKSIARQLLQDGIVRKKSDK
jgi:hypothetical protein